MRPQPTPDQRQRLRRFIDRITLRPGDLKPVKEKPAEEASERPEEHKK